MEPKIEAKYLEINRSKEFLGVLNLRFKKNLARHPQLQWQEIETKLNQQPKKLWTLEQMENTGGEPDVVGLDNTTGEYLFFDCSPESPKGRRSLCYDRKALESRSKFPTSDTAMDMASTMGIEVLTEQQFRYLQELGEFDKKTSSWVKTPENIRVLGGAIFCDRRYNHVFTYHNGADSYYASRGFRGCVRV